MAGGEKAKSSGEYGEQIVKSLLDLFGWKNCDNGVTVPCIYNELHKRGQAAASEKHGIDYVFQCKSPLRDSTKQDILISVKCRDGYPQTDSGVKNKFKEFLVDIAQAGMCYPACETSKRKIAGTSHKIISSLIFWIDRNTADGREYESVVDKINDFYIKEDCSYETVSLIDNNRAQFLYTAIKYAKTTYGDDVKFFYINSGLNNSNLQRQYTGQMLPYEYVSSNIIPMAISQDKQKTLLLLVKDGFCQEYLCRLIGLSHNLTSDWAANIIIAFPNYNKFENEKQVISAKSEFNDTNFTERIDIQSYGQDFRNEV